MTIASIPSRGRDILGFVGFLAVAVLIAAGGRLANADAIPGWYTTLNRPPITPPNWVFGPVWSTLYLMMTVAAWLVWRRVGLNDRAIHLYWAQLALNLLWSVLFFGLHSPFWAGVEILVLIAAIGGTALAFQRIVPLAGWLLVPYLAWTSYAAVLTWWFWAVN